MRRLALSLLLLSPLLLWAAFAGFHAGSGKERSIADRGTVAEAIPQGEARSGSGKTQRSGDGAADLPKVRPVQWHRFLPGMFR